MFRIAKTAAALSLVLLLVACSTIACKVNDENEIIRTVSEYCRLLDQQRGRGLAQLFTENATFTHHGSEPVRGNRAIEATFGRGPARSQPRIHVASNPIINVDGDKATGSIDHVLLERNEDGTFAVVLMGRWVDSYVRVADRWLIAERTIEFPYGEPSSRVKPPEMGSTSAREADLPSIDAALKADRLKSDFDEDSYRKPREVLEFLGARPGMKVIDVGAGRGYYSELLSRVVGVKGVVIAQNRPDVSRMAAVLDQRYGNQRLPNVQRMEVDRNALALEPGSLDAAILIMVYHDMYLSTPNGPAADPLPFVRKLFAALKPGGVVLVQDHIADPGQSPQEVAQKLHRIDPEVVKRDFTGAGFVFDGASDAVRNPADDHKLSLRDAVAHQTDRAMLRFRKP